LYLTNATQDFYLPVGRSIMTLTNEWPYGVLEPHWKQLLHLISCERYRELQRSHF